VCTTVNSLTAWLTGFFSFQVQIIPAGWHFTGHDYSLGCPHFLHQWTRELVCQHRHLVKLQGQFVEWERGSPVDLNYMNCKTIWLAVVGTTYEEITHLSELQTSVPELDTSTMGGTVLGMLQPSTALCDCKMSPVKQGNVRVSSPSYDIQHEPIRDYPDSDIYTPTKHLSSGDIMNNKRNQIWPKTASCSYLTSPCMACTPSSTAAIAASAGATLGVSYNIHTLLITQQMLQSNMSHRKYMFFWISNGVMGCPPRQ